jgi:hypothetical protein
LASVAGRSLSVLPSILPAIYTGISAIGTATLFLLNPLNLVRVASSAFGGVATAAFDAVTAAAAMAFETITAGAAAVVAPEFLVGAAVVGIAGYFLYTSGVAIRAWDAIKVATGSLGSYIGSVFEAIKGKLASAWQIIRGDALTAFAGVRDAIVSQDWALAGRTIIDAMKLEVDRGAVTLFSGIEAAYVRLMTAIGSTVGVDAIKKIDADAQKRVDDAEARLKADAEQAAGERKVVDDKKKEAAGGDSDDGDDVGRLPGHGTPKFGTFNPLALFGVGGGVNVGERIAKATEKTAENTESKPTATPSASAPPVPTPASAAPSAPETTPPSTATDTPPSIAPASTAAYPPVAPSTQHGAPIPGIIHHDSDDGRPDSIAEYLNAHPDADKDWAADRVDAEDHVQPKYNEVGRGELTDAHDRGDGLYNVKSASTGISATIDAEAMGRLIRETLRGYSNNQRWVQPLHATADAYAEQKAAENKYVKSPTDENKQAADAAWKKFTTLADRLPDNYRTQAYEGKLPSRPPGPEKSDPRPIATGATEAAYALARATNAAALAANGKRVNTGVGTLDVGAIVGKVADASRDVFHAAADRLRQITLGGLADNPALDRARQNAANVPKDKPDDPGRAARSDPKAANSGNDGTGKQLVGKAEQTNRFLSQIATAVKRGGLSFT